MQRAGVIGGALQDLFRRRCGAHVGRHVAALRRGAEDRERVQRRDLEVVGIVCVERGERFAIAARALGARALAEEVLHAGEQGALALGAALRRAFRGARCQAGEHCARGFAILLLPDRVTKGQRLAPVGQREVGRDRLRGAKRLGRVLVLETVQEEHAAHEGLLSLARARVRKLDLPEAFDARGSDLADLRSSFAGGEEEEGEREGSVGRGHALMVAGKAAGCQVRAREQLGARATQTDRMPG